MLTAIAVAFWLSFASQTSGLPIPAGAPMPTVVMVPTMSSPDNDGETDRDTGMVRLRQRDSRGEIDTDCLLAHELTHTLQVWNRQKFACDAEAEQAAYRVEAICYSRFGRKNAERWAFGMAEQHQCR